MGRTFDRELSCGCLISSDGGGAVIPCFKEEECLEAWEKWKRTEDYKLHLQEIQDRNE